MAKALLYDQLVDSTAQAIILLDAQGTIVHLTASAADLLQKYLPADRTWRALLPKPIVDWLAGQP